jgi:hypothetical protein
VTLIPNAAIPGNFSVSLGFTETFAGPFTDTFNLLPNDVGGNVSASLITITLLDPANNIDFATADINGAAFTFSTVGTYKTGTLTFAANLAAPLTVTVTGIAGPGLPIGTPITASYGGSVNVARVAEPATLALLGLGLFGIGVARRRKES